MLSPPPPPSLPPPLFPLEPAPTAITTASTSDNRCASYNPSIIIIAAIIAAAIVAAASIHLLLRVLSRSRSSSSFIHLLPSTSTSNSSSSQSSPSNQDQDQDPNPIINSLPLFSLSSSSIAKPSSLSSLDCAVCLSPFELSDQLRLLPSCRHAFHSHCIDTWLKSNLSCPLCRSPITTATAAADPPRSESFRVEIGSVSRRTDPSPHQPTSRSYSLGSSFDYVVDDEIEAVISRVTRSKSSDPQQDSLPPPPPPPGEAVAEIAGGGTRSWLKEYVDRLASSASSSFSSIRFSRRSSHRGAGQSSAGVVTGGESYDLERDLHLHLEEEDGGFSAFYRWLVGV